MTAREQLAALLECWGDAEVVPAPRKLLQAVVEESVKGPDQGDRLLRVQEAARLLGISRRTLYKRAGTLPFRVAGKGRELLFSQAGLQRWLTSQQRLAG